MKRIALVLMVPLILSACGSWRQPTPERQAIKDRCVAGDYQACSEIGHLARSDMSGAQPIVDGGTPGTVPGTVVVSEAPATTPSPAPAVVNGQVTGAQPIID